MAAYEGPDLLEEDFSTTAKGTAVAADDREELDNQVSSLQTKLADLNRARERSSGKRQQWRNHAAGLQSFKPGVRR